MEKFKGRPDEGEIVAIYKKYPFTWTCRIVQGKYYCATWHNGKQTSVTYYSEDKNEINELIRGEIKDGYKKVFPKRDK